MYRLNNEAMKDVTIALKILIGADAFLEEISIEDNPFPRDHIYSDGFYSLHQKLGTLGEQFMDLF